MRSELKLIFATTGLYTCYITYGILQERLFVKDEHGNRFQFTIFLLFAQCLGNALVAHLFRQVLEIKLVFEKFFTARSLLKKSENLPFDGQWHRWLAQIGFTYIFAMLSSNEALKVI